MARVISFLFLTIIPLLPSLINAIVVRGAISLGMGTVAFSGIDLIFETVLSELSRLTSGLSSEVIAMIGLVGVADGVNIMLSAGFALLVFKGMNKMGQARRQVWRKPGDKSDIDWGA